MPIYIQKIPLTILFIAFLISGYGLHVLTVTHSTKTIKKCQEHCARTGKEYLAAPFGTVSNPTGVESIIVERDNYCHCFSKE